MTRFRKCPPFANSKAWVGCLLLLWTTPPGQMLLGGSLPSKAKAASEDQMITPGPQAVQNLRLTQPRTPGAGSGKPILGRLASALPVAIAWIAIATEADALGNVPPGLNLTMPQSGLPSLNLSAPNASAVILSTGLQQALAQGNATGALPPLEDLRGQLASQFPLGPFLPTTLQDLPEAPPDTQDLPPSPELQAALSNLRIAQLNEAYGTLESIGYQLVAASFLTPQNPPLVEAFQVAGNQLLSIGYVSAGLAGREQASAARISIQDLIDKSRQASAASSSSGTSSSGAGTAAAPITNPWAAQDLAGALDPNLIYGIWQRLETDPSGLRVLYKITPAQVIKVQAGPGQGDHQEVRTQAYPGAVTGELRYQAPSGSSGLDEATGRVNVDILIEKANGKTMLLPFLFIHARSAGDGEGSATDILVEREGEQKAFVRLAKGD